MKTLKSGIISILFVLLGIFLCSMQDDPIASADMYGKQFVTYIKKNDSIAFSKFASPSFTEMNGMVASILADTIINIQIEGNNLAVFSDSLISDYKNSIDLQITDCYRRIQEWQKKDSIDVTKLTYVNTYFTMLSTMESPILELQYASILCKYDSVFYSFELSNIIKTQNRWVGCSLFDIYKYSSSLKRLYNEDSLSYDYAYEAESNILDSVAIDTAYYVEDIVGIPDAPTVEMVETSAMNTDTISNTKDVLFEETPATFMQRIVKKRRQRAFEKYVKLDEKLYQLQVKQEMKVQK